MSRLDIRLLGEFAIFNDGVPLTTINSQRLQCLLAYLLLHRDAPVARQRLAFLFWPDSTEAQARSNLRNLLHALSQALANGEQFLDANGQTVQWRAGTPYTLDVDLLLAALNKVQTASDLQQALDLYRGPLLSSCYDDWIVPERERLEQQVADVLQRFIDRWEKEGGYRDAIAFAQFLVRRDPLREDLYRQIMRLYALSGDRAGIARTYKECRDVLKRELEVEPSRQTVQAYEKYRQMDAPAGPAKTPAPASTVLASPEPPAPVVPAPPADVDPVPWPALAPRAAPNISTRPRAVQHPVTDATVRRALLYDAVQHPATEVPLALACIAGIYLLLWHPAVAVPAIASAAWIALALSAVAAGGSFIVQYVVKFDENYKQKTDQLQAKEKGATRQEEEAAFALLRAQLADGFRETRLAEGHYVLRDLDYEYQQLQAVIARHQETDLLSLSYLPALVDETYRQGLSVLEDTLELARATSSPKDQRLEAEIKELEDKIGDAAGNPADEARSGLWREKAAALRLRMDTIARQRLRLEQMLQEASKCETALNHTRVELASIKADSWTVSVNAVLETLQKTVDQAKAVQDEMRKLGY
jgi:DNA-binding SARP family transcriptional activator